MTSAKLAVAQVVKQAVAFERGDVDVFAAVIVIVGDGDSHAVHLDVEAAARGDVREGAVAIVAIERGQGAASSRRPVFAVDEQDVGPAVAIGIEKRASGPQGFRQILLPRSAAVVDEMNAGGGGDVSEDGSGIGSCGRDQEARCQGKKDEEAKYGDRRGWQRVSGRLRRKLMPVSSVPGGHQVTLHGKFPGTAFS